MVILKSELALESSVFSDCALLAARKFDCVTINLDMELLQVVELVPIFRHFDCKSW